MVVVDFDVVMVAEHRLREGSVMGMSAHMQKLGFRCFVSEAERERGNQTDQARLVLLFLSFDTAV